MYTRGVRERRRREKGEGEGGGEREREEAKGSEGKRKHVRKVVLNRPIYIKVAKNRKKI